MSPDQVAGALAWIGDRWNHYQLQAYREENGRVCTIPQSWWRNFCNKNLTALADRTRATEITHATGYQDWQNASLKVIPPGSFVWRDDYEKIYDRAFGPDGTTFTTASGEAMPEGEQDRHTALDFDPFIPDQRISQTVMEGFSPQQSTSMTPVITGLELPVDPPVQSNWTPTQPVRFPGYRKPLHDYVLAQHKAGKPYPKAREVLDSWKLKPPSEVPEVMNDGLKYFDQKGNTKTADLKSIQQAIKSLARLRADSPK